MDRQFLKFWGNFLLQAAENQKRLEDLTRWMTGGFSGADDLNELFRSAYGLKPSSASGSIRTEAWEQAAAQFQKAFSEYLALFEAVPRSRYDALQREKEHLEKKAEEQANTLSKLRAQLAESRMAEGKVLSGFQQLMDIQNEQFRQVSEHVERVFSGKNRKSEDPS